MQVTRFKTQYLPTTILIAVGVLVWVFTHSDAIAWYPATYAESAHGDPTSGVNRTGTECPTGAPCPTGDCTHCHDTFDDSICGVNELMLFAPINPDSQTENFCFRCHASDGAAQQVTNYTYAKNFGGGEITFTTIYDAFNPTTEDTPSSHNLKDIQDFVTGSYGCTSDTNACVICHNPHTAQDNHPVEYSDIELGGVKTAIREMGAGFQDRPANLWGDENFDSSGYLERVRDATNNYQAPYYGSGPWDPDNGPFEPTGDGTSDGSNLPNYVTFCLACHGYSTVPSTERGRYLTKINWTPTDNGDDHGLSHGDGGLYGTIAPYGDGYYNYVLSCTDCHEPHGSENEWLLRTCVNGKDNISVPGPYQWLDFCKACHIPSGLEHHVGQVGSTDCYNNGVCHAHGKGILF